MGYVCLFQFWFPQGIYLGGGLLGHAAAAKSFQSCPTLCDPIDGSPPGSGGFIPSFLIKLHTIFHSGYIDLPSLQQEECSLFPTSSPAFIVCRRLDDGHSDQCEVISHYSFDLHFSNNEQY